MLLAAAAGGGEAGRVAGNIRRPGAIAKAKRPHDGRRQRAEADRVGIRTLAKAGMDPRAMAYMFERLSRANRFQGNNVPEFLLTHPVTKDRIADSYNQASKFSDETYEPDLDYQLMRARVQVNTSRSVEEAITAMRMEKETADPVRRTAAQYGLALALTESRQLDRAGSQLESLRTEYPDKIAFILAEAEMHEKAER
ncbi:MAG: M48 family metalloprotease [Gammaproteobacteria bacterium]|nr:M48 family metalloprotease [Gammaproteobacteria bacterium]